ncbi:MAG: WD40 repeat domain-containing protein [Anaeromyxobacter sp.]|nr:WD40 repeat domain-containing protein [Anaeromyxobacter sp.]MBL0277238.1 WD40 repeat domain-containing protein [Anaeromyxobacter sp.]
MRRREPEPSPVRLEARWSTPAPDRLGALRFSPDGALVAAATLAGPVLLLDAPTGEVRRRLDGHAGGALDAAFSPDGRRLATCGQDGAVRVSEVPSGATQALGRAERGWAERVAFSVDGRLLASACGRRVRVHDGDRREVLACDEFESTVTDLCWAPDGTLYAGCYGGVRALRPASAAPPRHLQWKGSVLALALSPDQRWLVSAGQDASLHVWPLPFGEEKEMTGFPVKIRRLAFAPGALLLANDAGADVTLWDFTGKGPGGRRPIVLEGHADQVEDLCWTRHEPDAPVLLTAAKDGTVKAWGARVGSWTAPGAAPERLACSPAAGQVVVADADGTVHLLALVPA